MSRNIFAQYPSEHKCFAYHQTQKYLTLYPGLQKITHKQVLLFWENSYNSFVKNKQLKSHTSIPQDLFITSTTTFISTTSSQLSQEILPRRNRIIFYIFSGTDLSKEPIRKKYCCRCYNCPLYQGLPTLGPHPNRGMRGVF
jgi:hypothetical protein